MPIIKVNQNNNLRLVGERRCTNLVRSLPKSVNLVKLHGSCLYLS